MQANALSQKHDREEVARQIIMVLSTELGLTSNLLVGAMRDRASVNEVAMRTIRVVYNQVVDIGCFCHTLDHVGEHMHTPILEKFFLQPGSISFPGVRKHDCFGRDKPDYRVLHILVHAGGAFLRL